MFEVKLEEGVSRLKANSYAVIVGAYFGIVLIGYVYFGVLFQSPIGIVSLALIPVVFLIGEAKENLRDWVRFLILMLSYEALEGIVPSIIASVAYSQSIPLTECSGGSILPVNSNLSPFRSCNGYFHHNLQFAIRSGRYSRRNSVVYNEVVFQKVCLCHSHNLLLLSCLSFFSFPTSPPWYIGAAVNLLQKPSSISSVLTPVIAAIDSATDQFVSDEFAAFPSMHADTM